MKFKIDQNLPVECATLLVNAGYDAMTVYDQALSGAPDEKIVAVCKAEERILITADLDLTDIRCYPPEASPGFIVLRSSKQSKAILTELLIRTLPMLDRHPIAGRLWIVEHDRLRIRGG